MKSTIFAAALLLPSFCSIADDIPVSIPLDGEMANNLKPIIVGAPEQVNRSVRVTFLEATDKDITIMVKIGAVDTNKPKGESMIPDQGIITHTKRSIVNTYCAPFGDGNLFFDTFRQRKTTLNYHFEAATEVPLFSFTVSEKDCSI